MLFARIKKVLGSFAIDVTFQSEDDDIIAIYGASGAGKTSVISMIAGLIRPDSGKICVNGVTYFDSESKINVTPDKRRIGYIFQDGKLFPHLTVRSNLEYGMKLIPTKDRRIGFREVVGLLGLEGLLTRRPGKLSGGEKQRVAIGRALLTSPRLLLMDEPLASLDSSRKNDLLPFIKGLRDQYQIPVIYVTHSLEEIFTVADSVVVMEAGHVKSSGNLDLLHTDN